MSDERKPVNDLDYVGDVLHMALFACMVGISDRLHGEEYLWPDGFEYEAWQLVLDHKDCIAEPDSEDCWDARLLRGLALQAGGWLVDDDDGGMVFVSMGEWLELFHADGTNVQHITTDQATSQT